MKINTYTIESKILKATERKKKLLLAAAHVVADALRKHLKDTLLNASGKNRRGLRDTTGMDRMENTTSLPQGTLRKNIRVRVSQTKDGVKITPYFTGGADVQKVVGILEAGRSTGWVISAAPKYTQSGNYVPHQLGFYLDDEGPGVNKFDFGFGGALILQDSVRHPGLTPQPIRKMAVYDKIDYARRLFSREVNKKR